MVGTGPEPGPRVGVWASAKPHGAGKASCKHLFRYGPSYRKGKGVYMFGPSLTADSSHISLSIYYIPTQSYARTCMHA